MDDGIVLEYMLNQNTDLYNAWQLKEMFLPLHSMLMKNLGTEVKKKIADYGVL